MTRTVSAWRVATALLLLGIATAALGRPPRPTLPVGAVDTPTMTAFVVDALRCLITVAVWYLLVTTAVTALAALPRIGGAVAPLARRLTRVGLGVAVRRVLVTSAVVGISLPGAAGAEQHTADAPPVMVPIDPNARDAGEDQTVEITTIHEAEGPTTPQAPREVPDPPARQPEPTAPTDAPGMRRAPRDVPPDVPPGPPTPARAPQAVTRAPVGPSVGGTHHVVEAGESFWTIAAGLAPTSAGDEHPDLAAVAVVWQRLIDHNADILVDPGNPDLLHVGQRIELPRPD